MIILHEDQITALLCERSSSAMFIMDFDGTLLRSDRNFADNDLRALEQLGEKGIMRTIATGRSLYSFNTVAVENLPVDFVMFSTGAGVLEHSSQKIIRSVSLESNEVERACDVLRSVHLDFMVHRTIPDNHVFAYYQTKDGNADFERRLSLYSQFATPLSELPKGFGPATQLVVVVPAEQGKIVLEKIRSKLSDFNVIQTTSPLDGISTWIEIFPRLVSKSLTAAWLAEELGIDKEQIASVGNDYNDLDLLEWAENSYVVDNAPVDLKVRFPNVASNNNGGVAEAIHQWLYRKSV